MAHLDLAEGIHIEYELTTISGMKKCMSAQLDCTFDDKYQMLEAAELLGSLGLDNNVSLILHIDDEIYKGKI